MHPHTSSVFEFTVPGEPVAKARPGFNRKTGRAYTHAKTRAAENRIARIVKAQMRELAITEMITSAITMEMKFVLAMPKSWSQKKRSEISGKPCLKKPDIDNLEKIIDGINLTGLWQDDSLVWRVSKSKVWGDTPYSLFRIIF